MKNTAIITGQTRNKNANGKRWAIAQTKSSASQALQNKNIEGAYHNLINAVKRHYMKSGETYFERSFKADRSAGPLSMHAFVNSFLSLELDCELAFDYVITYSVSGSPHEAQIRKLLRAYPFSVHAKEVTRLPNVAAYYQRVLAFQDKCHIHVLQG